MLRFLSVRFMYWNIMKQTSAAEVFAGGGETPWHKKNGSIREMASVQARKDARGERKKVVRGGARERGKRSTVAASSFDRKAGIEECCYSISSKLLRTFRRAKCLRIVHSYIHTVHPPRLRLPTSAPTSIQPSKTVPRVPSCTRTRRVIPWSRRSNKRKQEAIKVEKSQ